MQNAPHLFEKRRQVDPSLTEKGLEQAILLASVLGQDKKHLNRSRRMLVSPMLRTLQTAQPIARALGIKPEVFPEIFEDGGLYLSANPDKLEPGLKKSEIVEKFSNLYSPENIPFDEQGWYNRPKETREETKQRAKRFADYLMELARIDADKLREQRKNSQFSMAQHKGLNQIWIVSHGTFLMLLFQHLLGKGLFCHHNNVGVTCMVLHPPTSIEVKFMNRIIPNKIDVQKSAHNYDDSVEIHPLLALDYSSRL